MPPNAPGKILVPRWVQLVGLPLAIVGVWLLVSAVNHAVFVFVVAALIAILLNPIVRAFCALRIPRGISVLLVYLFFAFVVSGMSVIVGTVIAREVQDVANQVEDQFKENSAGVTPADRRLSDLQRWIDDSSPVKVDVKAPGERLLNSIDVAHLQRYSGRAVDVARSLVITLFESLFNLVLVIVISVYMLLDAPRLSRFLRRVFRGGDLDDDLLTRIERALLAYVKGQTLVSLVIGTTAGVGLWILGITGVFPGGSTYALGFGAWAAAVEIIPYVGPWLGALAPAAVAATESATALIAVAALPLHPPDRGPHRHPQADGKRCQGAPAGRDLRPARRRRALRAGGRPHRHAARRDRPGGGDVPGRAHRPRALAGRTDHRPGARRRARPPAA